MNRVNSNKIFKLIIIPGNGCVKIEKANWYSWLAKNLTEKFPSAHIICKTMPDPYKAREEFWVPFIMEQLKDCDRLYAIGHSSGAVCIMRLLEKQKLFGAIIVSGCVSHLGEESEKISGYYPEQPSTNEIRPWRWDLMRENAKWIIHVGSKDDQFIPFEEMLQIKENLKLEDKDFISFEESDGKGHFMFREFHELLNIAIERIENDFNIVN